MEEREKYLKGMLEYCYQNKESFKGVSRIWKQWRRKLHKLEII